MTPESDRDPPWWRTHFDETWFRLHKPLFPPELSRSEVAGMIELLGLPVGSSVLDVPCGWGRHTELLREAGFEAFGADLSSTLLRHARRHRRGRYASFPYAAAELRALPFPGGCFDAAVNVFTSVGLFDEDREELRALSEIHRVLTPRGRLLLETMHRDNVVCSFAEHDSWRLPDGTTIEAERSFDPLTGLSTEVWNWRRGGEQGEKRHVLRLRTATEIAVLLRSAGFRDIRWFGGWDGQPFTHRSSELIAVATA